MRSVPALTQSWRATSWPTTTTSPVRGFGCRLPSGAVTPICVSYLYSLLTEFPSRSEVLYVVSGLAHGFDIGFRGKVYPQSTPRNLLSARKN